MDPAEISTAAELARELTAVRERAGLSVRRLAPLTGIVPSTLGGYFSGRHSPTVAKLDRLLRACGVTDPDELDAWRDALLRVRRRPRRTPAGVPYRGLASFSDADAEWLFGRDRLVADVVSRIRASPDATVIVVTGASGSGKSSLLHAGVVPRLRAGGVDVAVATPGALPVARPDVLVVDQFEEVFSGDERAAVAALTGAARVVLIALRADFTGYALAHPVLAEAMAQPVVVGPMTTDELREVIIGPAAHAGAEIEDGLPELLLRDADPVALPLLSHALLATWERSAGGRMTVAAYRETGGVEAAVARTADEVCAGLDAGEVRRLFLRLVHVAPDTADTRRRVPRDELADLPAGVLDAFVARRLLVAGTDTVEIAHEALLTAWPRLRRWLDADRVGLAAWRRFAQDAREWERTADDDLLPRGATLEAAEAGAVEHAAETAPPEWRFLAAAQERRAREAEVARRRARRRRVLIVALAVKALLATGLAAFAGYQAIVMANARDAAVSRELAVRAQSLRARDPAVAAQLAVAAWRVAPTVEARSALVDAAQPPPGTRPAGAPADPEQSVAALCARAGTPITPSQWSQYVPDLPYAPPCG